MSVKASCSQHIRILPDPLYPSTTSLTHPGSSRSQEVSTVRPRSAASGLTVSYGRARFPSVRQGQPLICCLSSPIRYNMKSGQHTTLRRLRHYIANVVIRTAAKDRSQTLCTLNSLSIQAISPVTWFLSVADQVNGGGSCCRKTCSSHHTEIGESEHSVNSHNGETR